MLTLVTCIRERHHTDREFRLGFELLKQNLPEHSNIIDATPLINENQSPDPSTLNEYVLCIREPSVFLSQSAIHEMMSLLNDDEYHCIIPSDSTTVRSGISPYFFSLNTFFEFEQSLFDKNNRLEPLKQAVPADAFMVKKEFLKTFPLFSIFPENVLTPEHNTAIALNTFIYSFINIYEESRNDVMNILPEVQNLLDVGCAEGQFGALLKQSRQIQVDGVEPDPLRASVASEKLNHVYSGSFDDVMIHRTYQCLTCLDVIEHIRDTDMFLQKAHNCLDFEGDLILSIPNIGHWSTVNDLLCGHWDYIPFGILCETHIRFFTEKSITAALERHGFKVKHVSHQYNPVPAYKMKLFRKCESLLPETDMNSLNTSGFLIHCTKI